MSESMQSGKGRSTVGRLFRDYGMVVVLLLLGATFSVLTLTEQHPTGAEAGRQVADRIVARGGSPAGVLIVARDTADDRAFADAVAERLAERGVAVRAKVNGEPVDARRAIAATLGRGESVDAIAVNDVTGKWTVYDQFGELRDAARVAPEPTSWPNFLKPSNLLGVANQTAIYAIIAVGMTMVIVAGGIDLSVGSLVALSSVAAALLIRDLGGGSEAGIAATLGAMLAGVVLCAVAGAFNGAMVVAFRIPAFIVTLSMMLMASGLAYRLSNGASISGLPRAFFWIGGESTLGLPHPVWLMVGLYVAAHVLATRTTFGRYVYAIGGNAEAARLSGVPVRRVLLTVYVISATLAGLGGIVLASKLHAGDPKFGLMYELEVIAAVVVGGTSLLGGSGRIFGTLVGAFVIAVIKNGMNLTEVDPFNQKIVLGAVLLAAVLVDTVKRRGTDR